MGRSSGTFAYVSDAHLMTSWIDHELCSHNMNLLVRNMYVIDKLPSSDHLPLSVLFDIDIKVNILTYKSADNVGTLLKFICHFNKINKYISTIDSMDTYFTITVICKT